MEKEGKPIAALFDLDGVVLDTESQYSEFWEKMGKIYHPEIPAFDKVIKGQTLTQIYAGWFDGLEDVQQDITRQLAVFESQMNYGYVPGVEEFLKALKEEGIYTAVVTSSNAVKMANVYACHAELKSYFDKIFTSEFFTRSKPAPDCYLLGAESFGLKSSQCVVFEDSFHGLEAGRSAGMKVVGLATTNPKEKIESLCDKVIADFTEFNVEKMRVLLR